MNTATASGIAAAHLTSALHLDLEHHAGAASCSRRSSSERSVP